MSRPAAVRTQVTNRRVRFYSRLDLIAGVYGGGKLLTRRGKLTSQSLSVTVELSIQYYFKIITTVIYFNFFNLLCFLIVRIITHEYSN